MASGVVANDTLYINMTVSDLVLKLREAEAEKMELKGQVEKKQREIESLKKRVKKSLEDAMKREKKIGKLKNETRKLVEENLRNEEIWMKKSISQSSYHLCLFLFVPPASRSLGSGQYLRNMEEDDLDISVSSTSSSEASESDTLHHCHKKSKT
ncbi:uncharacterized protein G2W53_029898 [Senna tora]|uniref:Uncharacterized protein n=1 Tax=Senna tora TaxID=362788 RepID=A0A834WG78_9FABA|nr:uncharacterized protein G2W53_029898 [Senna tora]